MLDDGPMPLYYDLSHRPALPTSDVLYMVWYYGLVSWFGLMVYNTRMEGIILPKLFFKFPCHCHAPTPYVIKLTHFVITQTSDTYLSHVIFSKFIPPFAELDKLTHELIRMVFNFFSRQIM